MLTAWLIFTAWTLEHLDIVAGYSPGSGRGRSTSITYLKNGSGGKSVAERLLRVGFTGTRNGMTERQKTAFRNLLKTVRASHLHHGDCIGADADAHAVARELGIQVELHPPTKDDLRAFCEADVVHEPEPYLHRNKKIVDHTKILVATPKTAVEEVKSGTWSTIRYARKQEGRSVVVIKPDGKW